VLLELSNNERETSMSKNKKTIAIAASVVGSLGLAFAVGCAAEGPGAKSGNENLGPCGDEPGSDEDCGSCTDYYDPFLCSYYEGDESGGSSGMESQSEQPMVVLEEMGGTQCPTPKPTDTDGPISPNATGGAESDAFTTKCGGPARRVCSMEGTAGQQVVSTKIWRWLPQTRNGENGLGFPGFMQMNQVRMEFRCISNTQAGVTSCGADVSLLSGADDPVCDLPWPYDCATSTSPLLKVPAFNNGIATITATIVKVIAWHWRYTPSIGFTVGPAAIGVTVDSSDNWQKTFQHAETCTAVCVDAANTIVACP
jgi:hypothetical protein